MPVKTKRPFALGMILLAIAALAALIVAIVLLIRGVSSLAMPHMTAPEQIRAVLLDDAWAGYFDESHTREEQEAFLTSTLDEAAAQGANTVLVAGSVPGGGVLARKLESAETAPGVSESDKFLSSFDPIRLLMQQASKRDMLVALYQPEGVSMKDWMTETADRYGLTFYTPSGEGVDARYTAGEQLELVLAQKSPALAAAVCQLQPGTGVVLGSLSGLVNGEESAISTLQYLSGDGLPDIAQQPFSQTLAIVSPDPASKVYTDTIFLMGTSDPSQPLTVNGQEVERYGSYGMWGLEVSLAEGDNVFTAQQGDTTAPITLTKPAPSTGSGSSGGGQIVSDGSVAAQPGQLLRVTSTLASALSDYQDTSTIAMTAYEGAVAQVVDSVSFVNGSKRTYAYQLPDGNYIKASDCELLEEGTAQAAFTGLSASEENGIEYLTFAGSGTPYYSHNWEGNEFTLHFYSASFSGEFPQSFGFVGTSVTVEPEENGFALHITFQDSDPLWGYFVDYTPEGGTRIALKHQPAIRTVSTASLPLDGVTVLLDPGHGGDDMGAPGSPVEDFPQESELNLSAALAAKYRLEQLGATVTMTRDTDVFYTLAERMEMLNSQKPDFFIAIHHNSAALNSDLNQVGGTEAYWFYTEGKPLATALSANVSLTTERNDRGPKYSAFYVTRSNVCPAVLLELGFVSNPAEYESCATLQGLWAEGGAIAQAVLDSMPD